MIYQTYEGFVAADAEGTGLPCGACFWPVLHVLHTRFLRLNVCVRKQHVRSGMCGDLWKQMQTALAPALWGLSIAVCGIAACVLQ